ncbi:MAG: GH92 family glycosyl hydrolase [Rikenellaceae bacterium]|nr:GH92 family glycosyl hydrolase [Rikenellaceae bacterium]
MKRILLSFISFTVAVVSLAQSPADYVDPFIGTSDYGATVPGPSVPMGMASMAPYNTFGMPGHKIHTDAGWCSTPYVYENRYVAGFTNVNLSGVGCPDFGSLLLMPTTGEATVEASEYCSELSDQRAEAGYYSTVVERYGVHAEMTATERTTRSRYTYPAGTSNVLFNIGLGLTNESGGMVRIVSEREIEGFRIMGGFCYNEPQSVVPVYFVVRLSKPAEIRYWKRLDRLKGIRHEWEPYSDRYKIYSLYKGEMAGDDIGAIFTFATEQDEEVEVSVGISYVSIDNARDNLDREQEGRPFDTLRAEARDKWNDVLGRIEVEGGTRDDKVMFYTALYHTYIHPNILSDANGDYPSMVRRGKANSGDRNRLTMFSGWDVYRLNAALMSLTDPGRGDDMAASLMDMYRESGNLPKFEIASGEFMVMEGDPAIPYLADLYMRGAVKSVPAEELYEAMRRNAFTPGAGNRIRPDNDFYTEHCYVPYLKEYDSSVSQALEYYMADYALSRMALSLGRKDDYKELTRRTAGYKRYFDPEYRLLRPVKPDGSFMEGFDPEEGKNFEPVNGFHEGCSWNYSFYVPYDIKGLSELMGGGDRFVEMLDRCFDEGHFDMSNEPDMGYPYYYSLIEGNGWRTQQRVRRLIRDRYSATPGGLPGNDDAGTMSAWLLFSMMGLYPTLPGSPDFIVTSPVFDKITIKLDPRYCDTDELVIETHKEAPDDIYIKRISVGGKPLDGLTVGQRELTSAGRMDIWLTGSH